MCYNVINNEDIIRSNRMNRPEIAEKPKGQTPYFRAILHVMAFPAILIPCWILWPHLHPALTITISFTLMASVYWGVWLLMKDITL